MSLSGRILKKPLMQLESRLGESILRQCSMGSGREPQKYKVALADYEEGLHSLITRDTCTCGLKINDSENLLAIIESEYHRNHKTLEPEFNPKFRGLVGRRISWPLMGTDQKHEVDALWDRIVIGIGRDMTIPLGS